MKQNKDNRSFKNKAKLFFDVARRLICVPVCASCRTRLDPIIDKSELDHGIPCLCEKCISSWQQAKTAMCHNCSNTASKCTCMPLKNTFTQPSIPSLFFYHPSDGQPQSKAIYTLKHHKYTDLVEFISYELSPRISELLDELEIAPSDCILTYIPRSQKAFRKYGFDQSMLLANSLCEHIGASCCLPLLTRNGGKEQKRLSKTERNKNIANALYANTELRGIRNRDKDKDIRDILHGKTVVLIDDIITTGASVSRGMKVLRSSGAKTVLAAAVARCEISKKNFKKANDP